MLPSLPRSGGDIATFTDCQADAACRFDVETEYVISEITIWYAASGVEWTRANRLAVLEVLSAS